MEIIRATEEHISEVAHLFDLYRQFYKCSPDINLARDFISNRIRNDESSVFVARHDGTAIGFVQMYPSFCSVDAIKIFILYDLYVDSSIRSTGVGALLMNRATEYAREQGASRIDLLTEFTNTPGQRLYEKLGYKKVSENFYSYSLPV